MLSTEEGVDETAGMTLGMLLTATGSFIKMVSGDSMDKEMLLVTFEED